MKHKIIYLIGGILFFFALPSPAFSQFDLNGQLVQRAEFRHGFGTLLRDTLAPSAFISQRLRLQAGYKYKKLQFYASIQDIRTFGNTPQVKLSDGLLSLHEGWSEIALDSFCSVKIGRQELNYDNVRFLGNLDWSLQARSHDFLLAKFEKKSQKLHIGGGYNQNGEALNGNVFTIANQYKTAQMVWYNYKKNKFEVSLLFWNNGRQALTYNPQGGITAHSTKFSQTIAIPTLKYVLWKNNVISAFAYYQTGKDIANKKIGAYDINLQTSQTLPVNEAKNSSFKITLGAELISGTNTNNTEAVNHSFSPMYGTNHAHNGYMDYFFVGGRFENSVGLNDIFLRLRYDFNKKLFFSTNIHHFSANAKVFKNSEELKKVLGTEIDLSTGWIVMEDVSLQAGYSQMFGSSTLQYLQNVNSPASLQSWAYIMLIIRPKSDKKFIGLTY